MLDRGAGRFVSGAMVLEVSVKLSVKVVPGFRKTSVNRTRAILVTPLVLVALASPRRLDSGGFPFYPMRSREMCEGKGRCSMPKLDYQFAKSGWVDGVHPGNSMKFKVNQMYRGFPPGS
jgi:hypothetical protein